MLQINPYFLVMLESQLNNIDFPYQNEIKHSEGSHVVLGYDNAHNYHHRHYMGGIEPVVFKNFEDIETRFQQEFEVIHEKLKKKK
jgi:hypothetical protein